ncbi:MAG TPA: enoyl-CoA hydratase [Vicinamibacterales bacterium]|jgi:enoyl-CoA hydratase/carnithine racemase|nr:enoyl-CoA hydratase [Vicinamibacterales bacterium]
MPSSNALFEIDGPIATLTFNRPQARNALTWDMYGALVDACERADTDAAVRVLVVRGAGEAFAAGTDIEQFKDFDAAAGVAYERRLDAIIDRVEQVRRATIAQIHGPAAGGGFAIALACDFRICGRSARFGVPIARTLGNCLSVANCARAMDLVGPAALKELLLTGRFLEAQEALAIGLASRVVPDDALAEEVRSLAAELATRAPLTIETTKAMLQRLRDHRRPAPVDDLVARCYGSADFREGVTSFLAKRPPRWTGA